MTSSAVERSVPPIGRFIDVDGSRMHYVDRGEGPPIVLIHGLGGVLQNFTYALVDRLARTHRTIALDRPGAGYSTRARGATASLRAQAATIVRFIEALGLERPLVVGHSLGGAIALVLALDRPDIPRALTLIAPLTQPQSRAPGMFRGLELPSPLLRGLVAYTIAVPLAIRYGTRIVHDIFAPEAVPEDFAIAGGGLLGLRPKQFYATSSDMMASREEMPSIAARYGDLALPVRVLFGTEDRVLDYRVHAERLREQIAGADITLVPGGHMLPVTQPGVTAAAILAS